MLEARVNLVALTNQKGSGRKEPTMIIIGCDYHPGFQQIAFVDTETGDCGEQCLEHCEGAEKFYRDLAAQEKRCAWAWKPARTAGGSNDSWRGEYVLDLAREPRLRAAEKARFARGTAWNNPW